MHRRIWWALAVVAVGAGLPAPAGAYAQVADSTVVVPGARYAARNGLHAALLGRLYRELWTTPITVPVLDLGRFAGGLAAVRTGGFQQTLSLRLRGADGREYNFRSVDKELTPAMPPFTRETFVDWVRQDQTSAQFPPGPIVAAALLDAVGILNPGPRLMVMPDDPRLGEFRATFAGMLGTLEVHPQEAEEPGGPTFAGAERVSGSDRLLEHLEEDLDHRVDSRAFLKARLMDVFLGDYDRHGGQWRWARYERDGLYWWVPVPEDRDYAFASHDGLLLALARRSGIGRLVRFEREYPDLLGMVDNSLVFTRYLVSDLTREDWEEVVAELEAGLTDEVIRGAVERLPPPHFALAGEELIDKLIARRDGLREMAGDFYRLLNYVVEVHGTDEDDRLEIDRGPAGVEVRLFAGGAEPPRFRRLLDPEDTEEVRVYLEGGDDRAVVRGSGGGITVHVIGGGGDDTLIDESAGPTFFYDHRGDNEFARGRRTFVDVKPWDEPPMIPPEEDEDEEGADAAGNGVVGPGGAAGDQPTAGDRAAAGDADAAGPGSGAGAAGGGRVAPPAAAGDAGVQAAEVASGTSPPEEGAQSLIPGLERDWGWMGTWFGLAVDWEPHAELVVGVGPRLTTMGYRHQPYRSRTWGRLLYAPLAGRWGVEGQADLRRLNSSMHLAVEARYSNLEATVFHGFGNESPAAETRDRRIWREHAEGALSLYLVDTRRFGLRLGPRVERIAPETDSEGARFVPADDLAAVTRVGGEVGVQIDTRDSRVFPRRGLVVEASGKGFPAGAGGREAFTRTELAGAGFLPVPMGVLALRAGAKAAFGSFPFYDAVFLGGSETLRGHHFQRFAGDRAAFGGASLRIPLAPATMLVHGTIGTSFFVDAGRVWMEGDSPGGWHTAVGGSLWFQVPVGAVSLSYARGEEDRLYFRLGMPF